MNLLSSIVLAVCVVGPRAVAQTPAGLAIETYAGLTITGAVDTIYQIEYTTDLERSNDWRVAGALKLPTSLHLWFDQGAPMGERRFYRVAAVEVEPVTNMLWIPSGTFTMGSPSNELSRQVIEGPQTVVTLTRGFFMGKYEVTQGEYADVIGSNPSFFRNGGDGTNFGGTGSTITNELRHPVESVSWIDATNYCARLTERERVAGSLPPGWRYRLPTWAEWEFACRAGTTSAFYYGPALRSGMANFDGRYEYDSSLGTMNNIAGINLGRTAVIGSYEANEWGLYDMTGNVWEWCSNYWSESMPGGRVFDPQGPAGGCCRLFRGGGWNEPASRCRSAGGNGAVGPTAKRTYFGFRLVLAPGQ